MMMQLLTRDIGLDYQFAGIDLCESLGAIGGEKRIGRIGDVDQCDGVGAFFSFPIHDGWTATLLSDTHTL
jgi:hypothetical protein